MIKSHFCKAESDHLGVCVCVGWGMCVCLCVSVCVCMCERKWRKVWVILTQRLPVVVDGRERRKKKEKDNCSKNKAVRLPSIYVNWMLCAFMCK